MCKFLVRNGGLYSLTGRALPRYGRGRGYRIPVEAEIFHMENFLKLIYWSHLYFS